MQQGLQGHKARKRFGQNFLHDAHWIGRIARAVDARHGDRIIEIGPGQAALTRELIGDCGHISAVEIDRDLAAWLRTQFSEDALTLIEADALSLDWKALAEESPDKPLRIVGNLPYNISSPLLFALMQAADNVADQHFMLQREVVDRIAEKVISGELRDRSHVLIDLDAEGDYTCRVEGPMDLDGLNLDDPSFLTAGSDPKETLQDLDTLSNGDLGEDPIA